MATETVNDLKARCEALGYRLHVTTDGAQLVVDHYPGSDRAPEVVFIHDSDADDDLEEWIADREKVSERVRRGGKMNDTPLERARDDAQRATYELRNLVSAALAINEQEADDGRIEEVLNAAQAKVVKLGNDLDSVNWPKSAGELTEEREQLFECLRRQAHTIVNAKDGRIAKSLADRGQYGALLDEIERLRGWLETIDDKLGVLNGAHEYGSIVTGSGNDQARDVLRVAETDTERALRALDRADRLLEVCATSVRALDAEHSERVAFTMQSELFDAIEEARKVLRGETEERAQ